MGDCNPTPTSPAVLCFPEEANPTNDALHEGMISRWHCTDTWRDPWRTWQNMTELVSQHNKTLNEWSQHSLNHAHSVFKYWSKNLRQMAITRTREDWPRARSPQLFFIILIFITHLHRCYGETYWTQMLDGCFVIPGSFTPTMIATVEITGFELTWRLNA